MQVFNDEGGHTTHKPPTGSRCLCILSLRYVFFLFIHCTNTYLQKILTGLTGLQRHHRHSTRQRGLRQCVSGPRSVFFLHNDNSNNSNGKTTTTMTHRHPSSTATTTTTLQSPTLQHHHHHYQRRWQPSAPPPPSTNTQNDQWGARDTDTSWASGIFVVKPFFLCILIVIYGRLCVWKMKRRGHCHHCHPPTSRTPIMTCQNTPTTTTHPPPPPCIQPPHPATTTVVPNTTNGFETMCLKPMVSFFFHFLHFFNCTNIYYN